VIMTREDSIPSCKHQKNLFGVWQDGMQTPITLQTPGGRADISHLGNSRRQNKGLIPLEDLRWQLHSLYGLGCRLADPTCLAWHLLTKAGLGQGRGQGWGQHSFTARHCLTCCTYIAADVTLRVQARPLNHHQVLLNTQYCMQHTSQHSIGLYAACTLNEHQV